MECTLEGILEKLDEKEEKKEEETAHKLEIAQTQIEHLQIQLKKEQSIRKELEKQIEQMRLPATTNPESEAEPEAEQPELEPDWNKNKIPSSKNNRAKVNKNTVRYG